MNLVYAIKIELLEDLHTGTGTGNLVRDGILARDGDGRPVIDRHHFRGVLRDNARRLVAILASGNSKLVTQAHIDSLFGKPGGAQRKLDCSSLKIEDAHKVLDWTSTARVEGQRQSEAQSLRTLEYLAASTKLSGKITLRDVSVEDIEPFEHILRFTTRLGAGRTRGSGQFRMNPWPTGEEEAPSEVFSIPEIEPRKWYRLAFINDEPLTLPQSGYAGNIIHSESHVPGRTLLGAMAALAAGDDAPPNELFGNGVSIGNGYPLPDECKDWAKAEIMPFPVHVHQVKPPPGGGPPISPLPHWMHPCPNPVELDPLTVDRFALKILEQREKEQDEASLLPQQYRRPKGEQYLYREAPNAPWQRCMQPLETRMRNRRGDPTKPVHRKRTDLFSEQRIPRGVVFVADCCFGAEVESAEAWQETLNKWGGAVIAVGRGKAPCRLSTVIPQNDRENGGQPEPDAIITDDQEIYRLTLTLSSDWHIHCPTTLGDLKRLELNDLLRLFGKTFCVVSHLSFQEAEQHNSFNYASGLPRRPKWVIKRGSSFSFASEIRDDIVELQKCILKQPAWGEGSREGYGRYRLDIGAGAIKAPKELEELEYKTEDDLFRERAVEAVKEYCSQFKLDHVQFEIEDRNQISLRLTETLAGNITRNSFAALFGPQHFDHHGWKVLLAGGNNDIRKWLYTLYEQAQLMGNCDAKTYIRWVVDALEQTLFAEKRS